MTNVGRLFLDHARAALEELEGGVLIAEVKSEPRLKDMALVKYSRLSVQPVTEKEWELVCGMGGMGHAKR